MAIFNDFITLKEAAAISGYHPDYIGALVRSNKVTGKKIGKNWYVSRKEVQDYLSTKHYVPVTKAFSFGTKVLFFFLFLILVALAGWCVFFTVQSQSAAHSLSTSPSAVLQSNQNDAVDSLGSSSNQSNDQLNNTAQPIPVISQ